MHRLFITIIIIALGTLIAPLHAFELYYHHDASGQRRDGSKLFDIVYELTELDPTDTVQIFIYAITQIGETLAFCTTDTHMAHFPAIVF